MAYNNKLISLGVENQIDINNPRGRTMSDRQIVLHKSIRSVECSDSEKNIKHTQTKIMHQVLCVFNLNFIYSMFHVKQCCILALITNMLHVKQCCVFALITNMLHVKQCCVLVLITNMFQVKQCYILALITNMFQVKQCCILALITNMFHVKHYQIQETITK